MHLLLLGDCTKTLAALEPNQVHLVVTSPPYNFKMNYDGYDDNREYSDYWQFTRAWLDQCFRLLCEGGRIAVNIPLWTRAWGNHYFPKIYGLMHQISFVDVATIVWVKRFSDSGRLVCRKRFKGAMTHSAKPFFHSACELIVLMRKPGRPFPSNGLSDTTTDEYADWMHDVWEIGPDCDRTQHPTPFPLELPRRLIKLLTEPGQVVLDPFIGSGTTLVASHQLERRCIGCELSLSYIDVTRQRVPTATVQVIRGDSLAPKEVNCEHRAD